MTSTRRVGAEHSATRALILDATQDLMVEEGYAAVSTRRVAAKAGIKPALVQYYFPTMDELLLAVYRRAAEQTIEREAEALASAQPLKAFWKLSIDPARTALAVEFMALANHRKVIRAEIARYAERQRGLQAQTLSRVLEEAALDASVYPSVGLTLIMAGIARALIMEQGLGIGGGHAEASAIVERWLQTLEPPAEQPSAD
jgi:AcrR family transcriptional regulator